MTGRLTEILLAGALALSGCGGVKPIISDERYQITIPGVKYKTPDGSVIVGDEHLELYTYNGGHDPLLFVKRPDGGIIIYSDYDGDFKIDKVHIFRNDNKGSQTIYERSEFGNIDIHIEGYYKGEHFWEELSGNNIGQVGNIDQVGERVLRVGQSQFDEYILRINEARRTEGLNDISKE
ncbi:MAG: hypothetical protein Q8Q01_04645 [archaeon]|nr:hypothetical protein [archaeon]